ncbi:MAG TPA: hotdog fold domain-containing protein [Gemmatimonadales bacterium]
MPSASPAPGLRLLSLWRRLAPLPGGRWLFSRILGWMVPYSGSIHPRIEQLEPGDVRLRFRDRRGLRNHLHSVHAIALANGAELASGLAMITALPPDVRGIVVRITVRYPKKARGTLAAAARCTVPPIRGAEEHEFESTVTDAAGDVVAQATVRWRLAPVPPA